MLRIDSVGLFSSHSSRTRNVKAAYFRRNFPAPTPSTR